MTTQPEAPARWDVIDPMDGTDAFLLNSVTADRIEFADAAEYLAELDKESLVGMLLDMMLNATTLQDLIDEVGEACSEEN